MKQSFSIGAEIKYPSTTVVHPELLSRREWVRIEEDCIPPPSVLMAECGQRLHHSPRAKSSKSTQACITLYHSLCSYLFYLHSFSLIFILEVWMFVPALLFPNCSKLIENRTTSLHAFIRLDMECCNICGVSCLQVDLHFGSELVKSVHSSLSLLQNRSLKHIRNNLLYCLWEILFQRLYCMIFTISVLLCSKYPKVIHCFSYKP